MSSPIYDSMQAMDNDEKELTIENVQKTFAPGPIKYLQGWWVDKAEAEISDMLKKTGEYGGQGRALDLIGIGQDLAHAAGRGAVGDAEATELGIWFYIRGKVGRAMAAISDGRMPSDDTVHDLLVYGRMIQRTREAGGWPD